MNAHDHNLINCGVQIYAKILCIWQELENFFTFISKRLHFYGFFHILGYSALQHKKINSVQNLVSFAKVFHKSKSWMDEAH